MKERIFKNWATSAVGLILIGFSMLAFWTARINLETFLFLAGAGCAALGLKDTILKGKP